MLAIALPAAPVAAQELTPLAYQLNGLPQGEHCGFFEAQAGGLCTAAGLEVTVLGGGPDRNVSLLPAAGQADLDLVTGGGTLEIGGTTARRRSTQADCMNGARRVAADIDISTGYDPIFLT